MARRAEKNGESESTRTLNYKFHEMKETRTKAAGLINKSTRGEIFKLKVISTSSKTYDYNTEENYPISDVLRTV